MGFQPSRPRSALVTYGLLLIACFLLSSPVQAASAKRALELLGEDRYRDALQEVEKVLEDNPEDAGGYCVLARIQFQLTRLTEAQQNFEKAVELDSDYADIAASYLARVAFFRGEDEECKQHLTRCDAEGWVHHRLSFLMAPPDMKVKKTRHYIVHGDDGLVATGGLTYAAHLMELIHDSYSKVFPFKMKEKLIHRVYVFSSDDTYAAFNRASIGKDKLRAVGYFSPSTRTLVINADPHRAEPNPQGFTVDAMDTMFHEGFHQFIHMYAPSIPHWFNEGLAEYFGPSQYVPPRSVRVGVVHKSVPGGYLSRYQSIMKAIHAGQHIPFREFLTQTRSQFKDGEGNRVHINYAQSWAFVHFLMHSKMKSQGRKMLKKYFTILREGGSWREAHKATFGKLNYEKAERLWIQYMKKL